MSYTALQIKPGRSASSRATSLMAPKGENIRDLPQFLNTDFAQQIINYIIVGTGQLQKRKGIEAIFTVAGGNPVTMVEEGVADAGTSDQIVFAFSTTLAVYTISTGVVTNIKTNFTANTGFEGARYGDFFFCCNGVDKVWRFDLTDLAAGATEITESPAGAQVVRAINSRLFVGEGTSVHYSGIDDGTNPPFTNFTPVDTLADGPGRIDNRMGGDVNAIEPLGQDIVVFQDRGKFAFFLNTIDSAGTLTRVDVFKMSRFDFGGARGAKMTSKGLFYFNESGLWQLVSVGNLDLPISDQEGLVSTLLGTNFFDNATLTNADIVEDRIRKLILVTFAKNSSTNNRVLAYHYDLQAMTEFQGLNVNRFMTIDQIIYIGSAIKTTVYQLFKGSSDDGSNIGTTYTQEIKVGDLETRQSLDKFYIQGFLSPSSNLTIRFNIFTIKGAPIENKKKYSWTSGYNLNGGSGWGTSSWSGSAWGGDVDFSNLIESFSGIKPTIRNLQRLTVSITNSDKLPHILNWFSAQTTVKAQIRRRDLTELS